jgi:hypothetical protein
LNSPPLDGFENEYLVARVGKKGRLVFTGADVRSNINNKRVPKEKEKNKNCCVYFATENMFGKLRLFWRRRPHLYASHIDSSLGSCKSSTGCWLSLTKCIKTTE